MVIRLQDFIDIYITPHMNTLEDAFFTLYNQLNIEVQTGVPLREIAKIVGTENIPSDDELLRVFIKGQIGKNTSTGTATDIISIWVIMSQDPNAKTIELYPAEVELYTSVDLPTGYEQYILDFMDKAASAGVSIKHIVQTPTDQTLILTDANFPKYPFSQGLSSTLAPSTGGRLNKIII